MSDWVQELQSPCSIRENRPFFHRNASKRGHQFIFSHLVACRRPFSSWVIWMVLRTLFLEQKSSDTPLFFMFSPVIKEPLHMILFFILRIQQSLIIYLVSSIWKRLTPLYKVRMHRKAAQIEVGWFNQKPSKAVLGTF